MAVVTYASGTTGQTSGGAESIISAPNVVGAFQLMLDMNLLAAGDVIEIRAYKIVKTGGTSRVIAGYPLMFAGAQPTDGQIAIFETVYNSLTDSNSVQFGIKQTFGTTRALPYAVLNLEDYTTTPAAVDVTKWNGTAVSAPATAGIPEVNVKNINNQAASAAAGVTFPATIASTTNITGGTITTVTNLTNAPTSGDLTAAMKTSVTTAATAATPTAAAVTGAVGSVTGNVGGNVTGSVGSVVGAVGSVTAGVTVTTNNDKTGYALTTAERNAIADAFIDRNIAGGSSTGRTIKTALAMLRNKVTIVAGTITVYDTDDSSVLWTGAVGTTAGNPLSSIDPT